MSRTRMNISKISNHKSNHIHITMKINDIKTPILTDGGLETTLIFHHGIELRHFAAFELLNKPRYKTIIREYYRQYLELAKKFGTGFILESATWRANPDWGGKLDFSERALFNINLLAIVQLQMLKQEYMDAVNPIWISGCIGPRRDGYQVMDAMVSQMAKEYHALQIEAFKKAGADMVTALTLNYIEEGLGIVESAKENHIPVVISFTVETDGNLPSGETLQQAIEIIDGATGSYPSYYMVNCAHPSHFAHQLKETSGWTDRIMGIRANASTKSHAELDESPILDAGDKNDLALRYKKMKSLLPNLKVYGGCCGTDVGHIEAICNSITE